MYFAIVSNGERGGLELLRTETFGAAKLACDNYKKDTGQNCHVESRHRCYTTSTLEESLIQDMVELTDRELASRGKWDGTTAHARVINSANATAAAMDAVALHAAAQAGLLK